jgi:hypothetical protein
MSKTAYTVDMYKTGRSGRSRRRQPSMARLQSRAPAADELRMWVPIARFPRGDGVAGGTFAFALCVTWFGWLL